MTTDPTQTTAEKIQLYLDWITIRWLLGHWDEVERLKVKLAAMDAAQ